MNLRADRNHTGDRLDVCGERGGDRQQFARSLELWREVGAGRTDRHVGLILLNERIQGRSQRIGEDICPCHEGHRENDREGGQEQAEFVRDEVAQ